MHSQFLYRAAISSLIALSLLLAACGRGHGIEYWFVDSLTKLFPDDPKNAHAIDMPYRFQAARNSNLSVQFVMRSPVTVGDIYVEIMPMAGPGMPIDTISVRRVENVVVTTNTPDTPKEELVREAPTLFPDALLEDFPMTLKKNQTMTIWITVHIPEGQAPGVYRSPILLRQGTEVLDRINFSILVHPASVPSPVPLSITNYFNLSERHIEQFYGCSPFSDSWWRLIRNMAGFMSRYHQTSIGANPVRLARAEVIGGRLRYDFGNFERFIETFQIAGVPGPVEGGNLLVRQRRRDAPVMVRGWLTEDGKPVLREIEFKDPRALQFLNDFLPALRQVLERRGWTKLYLQGILDEPNDWEVADFLRAAELVRKHLPGVRTIEPVGADQDLRFMEKTVDIWVPLLGTFEKKLDLFEAHRKRGGEVWFYTALEPRGRYPNRFIDYSLLKVRLLHWINFKYNLNGFLHWGGNYWGPEPLADTQPVINEGSTYLPPGDAYITYPDRNGLSLLSSIRLEQMREGIEDFGLLSHVAKQDAEKGRQLASEAVQSFTEYVRDPGRFREIHLRLLQAASQAQATSMSRGVQ
jgi:hypothetical protein